MTSRSEPDRPNASFYVGAEEEQDMKKRYLAEERSRQYKQMLREVKTLNFKEHQFENCLRSKLQ